MFKKTVLMFFLSLSALVFAQNPPVVTYGNGSFAYVGTLAAIPLTCAVGQIAFITDATPGQNQYNCTAPNTWTQNLNSGAAGANTALSNLGTTNLNNPLLFQTGIDVGSVLKPARDLYLFGSGTYGSTSIRITGTPSSNVVVTIPNSSGTVMYTSGTLPGGQVSGNIAGNAGGLSANIAESQVTGLTTDLAARALLAGGNTFSGVQTFGNNINLQSNAELMEYINCAAGTTVNLLAKLIDNAGSPCIQTAAISDISGIVGVVVSGAGTAGTVQVARNGKAIGVADNAITDGDYLVIGTTTAGRIKDVGSTYPTSGQVIGRALASVSSGATVTFNVYSPGIVVPTSINGNSFPSGAVANQILIANAANVFVLKTVPDCAGGSNALNYTQSTFAFSCLSISTLSNPMTTLGDTIYGGASGVSTRLAGPTGVNGVAQVLISTPSGGLATAPIWAPMGVVTNPQSGTTYTFLATDRAGYVSFSNTSAITATLPDAGTTGFGNNFVMVVCNIGVGTVTINRTTTSTISYTTGSTYVSGATSMPLTTGQCAWLYSDNTNYVAIVRGGGGSSTLNSVTAATVTATIANGNNPIIWNWAQTTNTQAAFTFGETSAATAGDLTSGLSNQAELKLSTASASTATPLSVVQGSITGTIAFPVAQFQTTWNNAGLTGTGLILNVTDTASNAASLLMDLRKGNASQFNIGKTGNLTALGDAAVNTQSTGSTTKLGYCAGAGASCIGGTEGTKVTTDTTAGTFKWLVDSTQHEAYLATNATNNFGLINRSMPLPIHQIAQTGAITTATLCAASAGACNVAGQYKVHFDFIETGTACSNVTAGSANFQLTWTDSNATTHSAVVIPVLNQTGATSVAVGNSFTFATALANAGASGDFIISTNGTVIQYATGYTACTTGTGTYQLDATVTRVQ